MALQTGQNACQSLKNVKAADILAEEVVQNGKLCLFL